MLAEISFIDATRPNEIVTTDDLIGKRATLMHGHGGTYVEVDQIYYCPSHSEDFWDAGWFINCHIADYEDEDDSGTTDIWPLGAFLFDG